MCEITKFKGRSYAYTQNMQKIRCFLDKFTQLVRILLNRRSWRLRQISTLVWLSPQHMRHSSTTPRLQYVLFPNIYIYQGHFATSHSIWLVVDLDFPPRSPFLPLTSLGGLTPWYNAPKESVYSSPTYIKATCPSTQ